MLSFIIVLLPTFLFTVLVLSLIEKNMTVYLLHFVFHIFFYYECNPLGGRVCCKHVFYSKTDVTSPFRTPGCISHASHQQKIDSPQAGCILCGPREKKKKTAGVATSDKEIHFQPGLRLLRPQRDFFFPPSFPTKCPSNLECQPPVILEWVWGLVNQVSFVYPGIDAIACKKKKKSRSVSTSRAAAMNSSAQLKSFLLLAEN